MGRRIDGLMQVGRDTLSCRAVGDDGARGMALGSACGYYQWDMVYMVDFCGYDARWPGGMSVHVIMWIRVDGRTYCTKRPKTNSIFFKANGTCLLGR